MSDAAKIRIATYNIRNIRALDRSSWWWRRRNRLGEVVKGIDADIWGLQEVYRAQNQWLSANIFKDDWDYRGQGRNRRGGGESCPVWVRHNGLEITAATTRWYGGTPTQPGTRLPGARFPRLATLVQIRLGAGGDPFVIANTHLDERSEKRQLEALEQLARWLEADYRGRPAIVTGDLNCTLDESPVEPLLALGLRPVLNPETGPTSHGFGRNSHTSQIDHIFVSEHWRVHSVEIVRQAGHGSDHWPVSAVLSS